MRKYRLWMGLILCISYNAYGQVCEVGAPGDFLSAFSKLAGGECQTLAFKNSMTIDLQRPLVLEKEGEPIRIEASERVAVRLSGNSFSSSDPALTIKRSQVTISNLIFENFPSNAIVVNGDHVVLEKMTLKNNGRQGASALILTGNDISVLESEIFGSGTNGVVITEDHWPPSCHLVHQSNKTRGILLQDNKIHDNGDPSFVAKTCAEIAENRYDHLICKGIAFSKEKEAPYAGYGVVVDGYQVRIEASEPGLASIDNNATAGIFFQSFSAPYLCKKSKFLHKLSLSKVSLDSLIALGPTFPKPADLSIQEKLGGWEVSGKIPFSKDPDHPYRLGPVAPRNIEVEIFSASSQEGKGTLKKYLGKTKNVEEDGSFSVELDKKWLTSEEDLVVAIATDTILNVSSPFSSLPGEDENREDDPEIPITPEPAPKDSDGDGVTDEDEIDQLKTDPEICDSDGDGLGDGLESGHINPDAKNPSCRGLPASGTNYKNIENLDPKRKDSDQDGLMDGEEDKNKNGWVDFDETDPTDKDSDQDGLEDGFENHLGKEGVLGHLELSAISNGEKCSPPPDRSDIDCDGFVNARDEDSDDDGCLDREEGLRDQNENGIADLWEQAMRGCGISSAPSSPTKPSPSFSQDQEPSQDETQGKTLAQEGVPAMSRGGGACSLSQGAQKNPLLPFLGGLLMAGLFILRKNYLFSMGRFPRSSS